MADPSTMGSRRRGSGTYMHRGLDAESEAAPVPVPVTDMITEEGCADG
jgi:hypothetical protein